MSSTGAEPPVAAGPPAAAEPPPAARLAEPLRRRGEAMRRAVLAATVEVLTADGLDATTVAAVALAAGVHETSIYRRWKTRDNLLRDAAGYYTDATLPVPDTGDLRADLRQLVTGLIGFLATPQGAALLALGVQPQFPPTAGASAGTGEDVEADRRRSYWDTRYDRAEAVVRRGVAAGVLAPDCDPYLLVESLFAPVFSRFLLTGQPLDDAYADALLTQVLSGVLTR